MSADNSNRRNSERYKLPANQLREGRFSTGYTKGDKRIRKAEIYDISQEGISFRIESNYAPELGEVIAIEFQLPNAGPMAWYAKVVRTELEFIEDRESEHVHVLRIATLFVDLPELRKKQLGKLIDDLSSRLKHADQPAKTSILSEVLTVKRRHEVTVWRYVRIAFIFLVSMFLFYEFTHYMSSVGSRYLRGSGPPIWEHPGHMPFEDVPGPIADPEKNK